LVAAQKALWRKDYHRGRRPVAPGLFAFCAVLAFSRWRFVRFAADQKATTTMAMIAEALAVIGGVPAKVLADRMGCLKGGVVAGVVVPTADCVRFATHYGFRPDWCHANGLQGHRGAPVWLFLA
jgi:transposase